MSNHVYRPVLFLFLLDYSKTHTSAMKKPKPNGAMPRNKRIFWLTKKETAGHERFHSRTKWPKWNVYVLGSVLSRITTSQCCWGNIRASVGSPWRESGTDVESLPRLSVWDSWKSCLAKSWTPETRSLGSFKKGREKEGHDKILINLPDRACCLLFSSGKRSLGLVRMEFQGS